MFSFMFSASILAIAFLVALRVDALSSISLNGNPYSVDSVITRDIAIIGGGSTGTYSAIRLKDLGKSVVVVEGQDRLGGHTQTYHDPKTGGTIDYGVIVWHNTDIVKNYFARLNVTLVIGFGPSGAPDVSTYMDYQTGKVVSNYTPSDPTAALGAYAEQLAKYPYVELGFDLPYPVPADLLLPFGDFVTKYNLEDMMGLLFTFAQGLGNLLTQTTLYVFKNFGSDVLNGLQNGFLTTTRNDNSLLYESATGVLGQDVVLNSTILAVDRSGSDGVKILIKTPSGNTLIKSSKLVFTIPPKLENLKGWDLDSSESSLFDQFSNSGYYTAIVQNSGVPDNLTIVNVSPNTLYNFAQLPALYQLTPSGIPGLINAKFGSLYKLADNVVKQQIISSIAKLQLNRTGENNPEFAVYSSHTPFELTVPSDAIAGGFYKKLYSLQGERHTFYTGAAFHTQDSSSLWQFTETLLPNITTS